MLVKSLKYDLRSVWRIWWIGAVTVLALSVPTGLATRDMILSTSSLDHIPWGTFVIMINNMVDVAFPLFSAVLVGLRYYSHFFTDNGYMTFTLPVKRSTLYLSKFLNAMVWDISATLVSVSASGIIGLFLPESENTIAMFPFDSANIFMELLAMLTENNIAHAIALLLAMTVGKYAIIYLGLTMGAIFVRKSKVVASLALMYAFFMAAILSGVILVLLLALWSVYAEEVFPQGLSDWNPLGFASIVICTASALIHVTNLHLLEKKLNLS